MMKVMRGLICAGALAVEILSSGLPVYAADLLELPRTSGGVVGGGLKDDPFLPFWPGFYFGGHAGGVWGNTGVNDEFIYVGDPQFIGNLGSTGFIGGGQAGYNIQRGQFVLGAEGDIGYLGLSVSKQAGFTPSSCPRTYSDGSTIAYSGSMSHYCDLTANYLNSGGLYGDLTMRVGYATGPALFYAKGGFAFADADFKAHYVGQNCRTLGGCPAGGPSVFDFGQRSTLPGWTIGGGVEYVLNPSWSIKAEYQHFDFGSMSYSYNGCIALTSGAQCPAGHDTSILYGKTVVSVTADALTVGLNYHLNN